MILPARFRGRERRLKEIYRALAEEARALHPSEVARVTGISIRDADTMLRNTPELFVRMPAQRGAPSRFRLASHVKAMAPEEVTALVEKRARGERQLAYAVVSVALSAVILMVLMMLSSAWGPRVTG